MQFQFPYRKHSVKNCNLEFLFSKQPNTEDGIDNNIGITDQRMFYSSNGAQSGQISLEKPLKTELISMDYFSPNNLFVEKSCQNNFY